jgi:superfamily II DNA/RNA helicase
MRCFASNRFSIHKGSSSFCGEGLRVEQKQTNFQCAPVFCSSSNLSKFSEIIQRGKVSLCTSKQPQSFDRHNLDPKLVEGLKKLNYTSTTEIQSLVIGAVLASTNSICLQAPTGTGKTLAFVVPLIQKLLENNGNFPNLLIVPSRELATQTERVITDLLTEFDVLAN